VVLPAHYARDLIYRHSFWSTQHRNELALLRDAFRSGWWLRVRQHLDRGPQFIEQRVAVTDPSALLDTGQGIP
jgi:hypothetical protein